MSRKTLRVDDFDTSLIPRDANDTAVLLLDLMEGEFVAVRCSASGSCLYNSISLLIKGSCSCVVVVVGVCVRRFRSLSAR